MSNNAGTSVAEAYPKDKCERIYLTLMKSLEGKNGLFNVGPAFYIREFFETAHCDSYYDLSETRKELHKNLNSKSPHLAERIMEFDTLSPKDDKITVQVLYHSRLLHEERLKAKFKTVDTQEELI